MNQKPKHRQSWLQLRKSISLMTEKELNEACEDAYGIFDHLDYTLRLLEKHLTPDARKAVNEKLSQK